MFRLFLRRQFCSDFPPSSWKNSVTKVLESFPYCYHPRIKIQSIVPQGQQQICLKQQANAFFELMRSNSIYGKISENNNQSQEEGYQINEQKIKFFNDYFLPKLNILVERIKNVKESPQQRLFGLKVLFFMKESEALIQAFQKIPIESIIDLKLEAMMIYSGICIKLHKDCLELIEIISSKIQLMNSQILKPSKSLIMIPSFWDYFPQKIIRNCIASLQRNIAQMNPIQLIVALRYFYQCPNKLCGSFIQELTAHIRRNDNLINHIPLLLKIVKIRAHHQLDNMLFSDFFKNNPKKFSTILLSKNSNKEVFLPLLTINNSKTFQNNYRVDFENFALQMVKDLSVADQIDLTGTLRTLKLINKYFVNLSSQAGLKITEMLLKKVIPVFEDPQIIFFSLLVICRLKDVEKQFKTQLTNSFEKIMKMAHNIKLGQLINLCYQVYRLNLENNVKIPSIFSKKYDYENQKLTPHEITYYFYLLKKTNESHAQKLASVDAISKQLMNSLEKGSFTSLQSIYTIIDALAKIQYQQNQYVWVNIQNAIQKVLYKNKSRNLLRKDLIFLNDRMRQTRLGSRKFRKFVQDSIKDYTKVDDYLKEYLQKAQNYHIWRQRYRRGKKNDQY